MGDVVVTAEHAFDPFKVLTPEELDKVPSITEAEAQSIMRVYVETLNRSMEASRYTTTNNAGHYYRG